METNNTLRQIAANRIDGERAAASFIRKHGIAEAKVYCGQLMAETPKPSPAMFGYIDGFANGVLAK